MIGAVVLVLVAALLLAWLLKGKNRDLQNANLNQPAETKTILGFPEVSTDANGKPILVPQDTTTANAGAAVEGTNPSQPQVLPIEPAPAATTAPAAGFAVRPTAPAPTESRQVVDTDGQVKNGLGNIGANETKSTTTTTTRTTDLTGADTQPLSLPKTESKTNASHVTESASGKDKATTSKTTVSPTEEKRSPRPVLVGEKAVPKDSELASGKSMSEIEKAAAEKSLALAKGEKAAVSAAKNNDTASASGDYSIQLMASADKAKAEEVRKAMAAEGYKVALVEAKVDGKAIYRVRVGDYPKKEDAVAAQAKMKERYTKNTYVQNSFVTR
jgi:cell division protein FtsN